jgi:hypothetical protein
MEPKEKEAIVATIQTINWDDSNQLSDCVSKLCQMFNEHNVIDGNIDDEVRISKLNVLYNWCADLYGIVKDNVENVEDAGLFWNRMLKDYSFYLQDQATKELSRGVLDFNFVKINNDIAKELYDKADVSYKRFIKYVVDGIKEIYQNTDVKDILGFESDFTRLRSHVSKPMLADSFNALDFQMYQEKGYLEMFVTILNTLQDFARGEQRKEIIEGIQRLINSLDTDSRYISVYNDFLIKYSS